MDALPLLVHPMQHDEIVEALHGDESGDESKPPVRRHVPQNIICQLCLQDVPEALKRTHHKACVCQVSTDLCDERLRGIYIFKICQDPVTDGPRATYAIVAGFQPAKVAPAIAKLAVAAKKFYQDEKPNMQSAMMVYNPATSSPNQASIDLAHHVALVSTQLRANTNLFTVLHTAISHEFQISVELSLDPATLQRSIGQLGGVEVKMTTYIGAQDANHPPPLPVARKLGVPSCCVDCDVCSTNGCSLCSRCCIGFRQDNKSSAQGVGLCVAWQKKAKRAQRSYLVIGREAYAIGEGIAVLMDGANVQHGVWNPEGGKIVDFLEMALPSSTYASMMKVGKSDQDRVSLRKRKRFSTKTSAAVGLIASHVGADAVSLAAPHADLAAVGLVAPHPMPIHSAADGRTLSSKICAGHASDMAERPSRGVAGDSYFRAGLIEWRAGNQHCMSMLREVAFVAACTSSIGGLRLFF